MSTLDPARPRTAGKQERLRVDLAHLVDDLEPGDLLPPERRLAEILGVARMTLRRAVDGLVDDGVLVRRAGSGTFRAGQGTTKVTQPLTATSFSADMRARGLRPGSRTVASRTAPAGTVLAAVLEVPTGTPVLHVRRLRLADDVPMALEDLHVPATVAAGLTGADLEGASYYDLLAGRGTPVTGGQQTVEPALVGAEEATLLGVAAGDPVFCFERTTRLADGRVAELVRSWYRGDRYRIVVDIFPPAGSDTGSDTSRDTSTSSTHPSRKELP